MIRAALYIRVSHDEQVLHGLSLEAQEATLKEYAQNKGYTIIDTYADEGITARKKLSNRKDLQRLLKDVQADKIDLILVTKLDRWFRNIKDYYEVQDILEAHNCNWKTVLEDYDTSTASGRLHINIMLSVNQDECDRTSERIKAVFKHKKEQGEVCSGRVPYGYVIKDKKLAIDEKQAQEIRDLFNYYERCNNLSKTRQYISNKYGHIDYMKARRRLTNEKYTGTFDNIKDYCPAIIPQKQFDNVQKLLKQNKKEYKKGVDYIFSGLLKCKYCGGSLHANNRKRSGKDYKIYRCEKAYRDKACTNMYSIPEKNILEKHILNHIKPELEKYKVEYEIKQNQTDKQDIACKLVKCRNKLEKLKDLYLDDLIDKNVYKTEYVRLNDMVAELEAQQTEDKDISHINDILNMDFESIYHTLEDIEKRYLWQSIIDHIDIGNNRNDITIYFK